MADTVANIVKGRAVELYNRVKSNDPANSAIIIIPVDAGATTDATFRDFDTVAAVLAGGFTERTTDGWNRKTLTDADLAALAVDDTNDRHGFTLPDQTWTAVTAGAVTDLLIAYDSDTTGGTDANLVPIGILDFPITPDGSDVVADFGAEVFRAS
jgi:hypothetical protein